MPEPIFDVCLVGQCFVSPRYTIKNNGELALNISSVTGFVLF